ncbi:MAG: cytochrome P450 [Methylohalobius sp.]|nr:cytochrome P450 [Methylohalobius sp.]
MTAATGIGMEVRPSAFSFLALVRRLSRARPLSVLRLGPIANIAFLTDPESLYQAAQLEKHKILSRQNFSQAVVFPILGEGVFSSDEAGWQQHKQILVRYLKPSPPNLKIWRSAARKAVGGIGLGKVDGIRFCRPIVQKALLEVMLGNILTGADRKRLHRLTHRMDAMAEVATFWVLVAGRTLGLKLAQPFQWIGFRARKQLEKQIDRWGRDPGSLASNARFREELRTLLFAGQDTTATALAFVLWMFGAHPQVQEEVRQDVLESGAQSPKLQQAILETLRLLPPVHTVPVRTAMEETEIGGVPIPKGTEVIYCLWFAHRCCAQPEEFVLERWADKAAKKQSFPFGIGPKHCVGEHLAMTLLTEMVAAILRQRRIRSLGQELVLRARTVLVPKQLAFRLERLSRNRPDEKGIKTLGRPFSQKQTAL